MPEPFKPVLVELPQPVAVVADPPASPSQPVTDASPAHTPYADSPAAPVPVRNAGAELDERPNRWTRGPVKIDPVEDDSEAATGSLLRLFVEGSAEEDEWVLGHRKKWAVDRRGLPMIAKLGLLLGGVLALVGIVWGFFYLLLKVVIAVNG